MLIGLIGPFSGDEAMLELFKDEALISSALRYEHGSTRACTQTGWIVEQNAETIARTFDQMQFESWEIVSEARQTERYRKLT